MKIRWEYEKEGYSLGEVKYLPDFWLPDQQLWIEIKGEKISRTGKEFQKAERLAQGTMRSVFIFEGSDFAPISMYNRNEGTGIQPDTFFKGMVVYALIPNKSGGWKEHDNMYAWFQCPECRSTGINWWLADECPECMHDGDIHKTPRLIEAYRSARQARFERNR
jgi:hypothetical protein